MEPGLTTWIGTTTQTENKLEHHITYTQQTS